MGIAFRIYRLIPAPDSLFPSALEGNISCVLDQHSSALVALEQEVPDALSVGSIRRFSQSPLPYSAVRAKQPSREATDQIGLVSIASGVAFTKVVNQNLFRPPTCSVIALRLAARLSPVVIVRTRPPVL